MKKLFLTVGAAAFVFLVGSRAEAYTSYSGTVMKLATDFNSSGGQGNFLVVLNGVNSPCTYQGFFIAGTNPNYKESVALLMQASAMGKTVTVYADGTCLSSGWDNTVGLIVVQ